MNSITYLLSTAYNYLCPEHNEPSKDETSSSSFSLSLGSKAQDSLADHVASIYPNRNYQFTPLPNIQKDSNMEVGYQRHKVLDRNEEKPYASGFELGFVVLMRSSTHLGVARIHKTIEPLISALNEMGAKTKGRFEVFIIAGKASDATKHEDVCRHIRSFNKLHRQNISISDDLFRAFDFKGPSPSQVPDVSFAGFDHKANPIAVIDYR
ncbi:MAG: hypothetical protein KFB95_08810 [Simkaniaceae bacterium]|nr:MAG: hypothetical protein KFB95_08810 [Simkaniaceae bacterium]